MIGFDDLDPVAAVVFGPIQCGVGALNPVVGRLAGSLRADTDAQRNFLFLKQGGLLDTQSHAVRHRILFVEQDLAHPIDKEFLFHGGEYKEGGFVRQLKF
jgi:hypothetical protein